MADTPSTTRSKSSKTPKRSRHSPPEAPTPKPLQKLSKTNKLDTLISTFLNNTPSKSRANSKAGRGSSGRGPGRPSRKQGATTHKGTKKKTVGQRRRKSNSPKTSRTLVKPLSHKSRAKSVPRTFLKFTSSEEDDDNNLNKYFTGRNNTAKSELSALRKQLATKWDESLSLDNGSEDSKRGESNDGWDFDEASDEQKAKIKNQSANQSKTNSTASSIPEASGLSKSSKTDGESTDFPVKISQESSPDTATSPTLSIVRLEHNEDNRNVLSHNNNTTPPRTPDRDKYDAIEVCSSNSHSSLLILGSTPDVSQEHDPSSKEPTGSIAEEQPPSPTAPTTQGTIAYNQNSNSTTNPNSIITPQDSKNYQNDTNSSNEQNLVTIQETEDRSVQSSNSQSTPVRATNIVSNNHTTPPPGRTVLNSTDLDNDEEDDINTQQSEETLTGNRDQTQTVLPSWIRFRVIINMIKPPLDIISKKQRGEEVPAMYASNDTRLLANVKSLFEHIRSFDDTSMVIEWSSKNDDSGVEAIIRPDAIPSAPSDTQKFFAGFKGKDEGPVYLRFRIITKFKAEDFLVNCKSWMKSNKCSLIKCAVQTEEAQDIGWLTYTSQFSDQNYIAKQLSIVVGHEIGLKLGGIAPMAEADLNWKTRTRALIVVAPREKALTAKNILLAKFREQKNVLTGTTQANEIFQLSALLPLEQDMAKLPNCKTNFGILLRRHQIYYRRIASKMVTWIGVDLDKKQRTPKGTTTLRKMILNIRSSDPSKKNLKLFQSIDYVEDGSKVYFPEEKRTGAATSGHIFQYFQTLHEEATVMIEGLGVYLGSVYSLHVMNCSFSATHWHGNIGWHWDTQKKVFVTPDEIMVQELVKNDVYAGILQLEETLLIKDEETKKRKDKSSSQLAMEQQELELIQILQNPDLDPITSLDQPVQQTVEEVEVSGQQSTTSSLTFQATSVNDNSEQSTTTATITNIPSASIASGSTAGTANTNTLRAALQTGDTIAEKRTQLQRLTNMRMARLKQREEQLMAELIIEEMQEESKDADTETRVKMVDKQVSKVIDTNMSPKSKSENTLSDMSNPNNKDSKEDTEESTSDHNTGHQK